MPGNPKRFLQTCWVATLFAAAMTSGLAAGRPTQDSESAPNAQAIRVQAALTRVDLRFEPTADSSFTFYSGDIRITVKADNPTYYEGKPFQSNAPQSGVYGPVNVSDKFYGIERVLHYAVSRGNVPYGGVQVQERITVLYENLLHRLLRPRVFDSKPFVIGKDGMFQDRQVMGHFDTPWPDNALQILKQELIFDGELVAAIYIVRTKKEVRIVGYSVPPLMPNFSDSFDSNSKTPKRKK